MKGDNVILPECVPNTKRNHGPVKTKGFLYTLPGEWQAQRIKLQDPNTLEMRTSGTFRKRSNICREKGDRIVGDRNIGALKGLPVFPIGRRRHLFTLRKSSVKAIVIVKTNLIGDIIDRKITVTKKPLSKCDPKIRNIIEDGFAGIFLKLPAYIKFAQITFSGNLVQSQFLRK